MRKLKNIYGFVLIILMLFIPHKINAQDNKSNLSNPASLELLKAKTMWFNSSNGAGLVLDKIADYNDILINYDLKNGDFKRKFEGGKERRVGVSTEGGLNIGGGYVWGSFAYNNEKQIGTLFNTTMLDPTRGIPYFTVDKNLSDWNKQDYNLHMKVSSKLLWNAFHFGLEGQYITKTGAKQVDPRSDADYYSISVKPGMVAMLKNHSFGLNFEYERLNQEVGTTNSNNQANQDVYVMRGLGNFYSAVVGGLQSLGKFVYNGNKVGGAFQYSLAGESLKLLFDGNYSYRVEDVISSQSKPKNEGTIKEDHFGGNLQLLTLGKNISKLELSYSDNKISGIEYVQVLDNTFQVQKWITTYKSIRSTYALSDLSLRYNFFKGTDFEYKWRAGASFDYKKSDDLYILPESYRKLNDLIFGVNGKANLKLKDSGRFLAGISVSYKKNLDAAYMYGGADASSLVITDFMIPDFQYLKRDYYKLGGEVSYFSALNKNNKTGIFVKAVVDYYKPTEGSDNRSDVNLGVGFTF
jgi:hypothetical protein